MSGRGKGSQKDRRRDGVFQREGRAGWYASYSDQSGRRRMKKLKASTESEARQLRAQIVANVEKSRVMGITPAGDDTFAELSDRYLKHQITRLSPKAYQRTEGVIRAHLKTFFKSKVSDIRPADVQRYTGERSTEVSAHSVQKELMILKHVLNLAVEWEIIPTSPAARIKAIKTPPGRLRYLYPEELRTLIDACPAWLKPIVQFAVSTGARRGSICDLRWRDISPDGQRATFQKTKSGRRHTIKLNDLARFALTTAWNEGCRPDDRIFGVQHGAIDSVSIAFHRAALKAKIDDFRFHDLRHTAASWLAMKGRSIREIAELLDHSTIQMTMRYSHLAPDFMEQTVKALDEVFHKTLTALPAAAAEEESRICPHNRPGDECDACLRDGDFAFDAAREARYK